MNGSSSPGKTLNKLPVMPVSTMLRVNEIFTTIQGEATFTGTPSTFVRLQGCPVGCPWCDTKYTWHPGSERSEISIEEMIAKTDAAPTWASIDARALLEHLVSGPRHVVFTGGEPFEQDLSLITGALAKQGISCQVETSGTANIRAHQDTWITVSPKINMPGGRSVLRSSLIRANEIKLPVEFVDDLDRWDALVAEMDLDQAMESRPIWLQPISQGDDATRLCIDACMERNYKLSIQTHKYAGLR